MKTIRELAFEDPIAPTRSVRQLLSKRSLHPALSVRAAMLSDLIGQRYVADGRAAGAVGIPMAATRLIPGGGAVQPFSGGYIRVLDKRTDTVVTNLATVIFLGFRCNEESDYDQGTPSDEPYFIIGVSGVKANETKTFGPFENTNKGDVQHVPANQAVITTIAQPPIFLSVNAMEADEGNPEEAAAKVKASCLDAIKVIQVGAEVFGQAQVLAATVLLQTLFSQVGSELSTLASSLLGLGDDEAGSDLRQIGAYNDGAEEWITPDRIVEPEPFSNDPYNIKMTVGKAKEGNYTLYFNVLIFRQDLTFIPPKNG